MTVSCSVSKWQNVAGWRGVADVAMLGKVARVRLMRIKRSLVIPARLYGLA
jgi:hypothetical protein